MDEIIPGMKVRTRSGYRNVLDKTERTVDHVYDVKCTGMEHVVVTEEHPFYVIRNKYSANFNLKKYISDCTPCWGKITDLKAGDFVGVPVPKVDVNENHGIIDLYRNDDENMEFDNDFVWPGNGGWPTLRRREWSLSSICKRCNTTEKVTRRAIEHLSGKKGKYSREIIDLSALLASQGFVKNVKLKYKRYLNLDDDLMYLIGWYIAEGSSCKGKIELAMGGKDRKYKDEILSIIKSKFGIDGYIVEISRNEFKVAWSCPSFARWLHENCGLGSHTKMIPLSLIEQENVWHLIRGMFRGDGFIYHKQIGLCYNYTTASSVLAYQIKNLLLSQYMFANLSKCNRGHYGLNISGDSLKKFIELTKEIMPCEYKIIRNFHFFHEGFMWVQIKSIKRIDGERRVQDIAVERDREFVGNGILLHNTMSEAMSMEIPTISTRWSGNLEFMNDNNSYLVDVLELREVGTEMTTITPNYAGQHFCEPSEEHLRKLMRYVYEHRDEAKAVLARKELVEKFSWRAVGARIIDILRKEY